MENTKSSNLELNPFYVTGFSDGEACFHLAIGKNPKYKNGYYVNSEFSRALHEKIKFYQKKLKLISEEQGY